MLGWRINHSRGLSLNILVLMVLMAVGAGLAVGVTTFGPPMIADTAVHVSSFEPSGRTDRAANITVKFSNMLVPADSLDRPVMNPPLKFDPPLAGIARWIAQDVLRFYPDKQLAPATEYRVEVISRESFINGNRISEKRTFSFFTPGLQIEHARDRLDPIKELPAHVRIIISLDFNYAVNLKRLEQQLEIKGFADAETGRPSFTVRAGEARARGRTAVAPAEESSVKGFARSCEIVTEPIKLTEKVQRYRLHLKSGLECDGCAEPLSEEFTYTMMLAPKERLVIRRVNARGAGVNFNIQVYLSASVDADDAGEYVSVEPETNFKLESARGMLLLRGEFRPGQSYTIKLAQGLPAPGVGVLEQEFSTKIQVPDLPPAARFTSGGVFLPREGSGNIELQTTNIDRLVVEVEQIFENNLVYFLTGNFSRRSRYGGGLDVLGRRIFFKEKELPHELNEPLPTTIDLPDIIGDTARGLFVVSARHKDKRWISDTRQVLLTDIGISARMGEDYLLVWAHSLAETRPLRKARVRLISKNNQVLAEGKTDSRGLVILENLADLTDGFAPYVITVAHENDLSYLRFSECLLPTSDFDVGGRPYLLSGYEAFVYFDRGIYRPGDTVRIVPVVRGVDATLPPEFPFLLKINDPQGRLFKTLRLTTGGSPLSPVDYAVPEFAPTGRYTITVQIGEDYQIGRADFLVEEFLPDRIKVELTTKQDTFRAGDNIELNVLAKFLFGPPAGRHRLGGSMIIEEDLFRPTGWGEYTFANNQRTYAKNEITLPDTLLDESGRHTYRHQLPEIIQAPSALKALLGVSVSEQGGRTVGAYKELTIHPYHRYVGLRLRLDRYAKPGEPVEADVIALNPGGEPVTAGAVGVRFNRIVYHTVLRQDRRGSYRYVSERTIQVIDSTTVDVPPTGARVSFVPPDYGEYELEVIDGPAGHAAAVRFYASGWGYVPWSMASPDRIELDLDQPEYVPGSTATVQVRAPFPGKLLLTVERERVLDMITVDLTENTAEIELPVKKDFFPNCYLAATLIRPSSTLEKHSPARAFGIAPLKMSLAEKKLPLTITAPAVIKPRSAVSVKLELGQPGTAELTVAAVDAGILQLTDFTVPDPLNFFYGKKRPHLKHYDMYSFVYPEVERAQSHLSAAGDRKFAQARKRHLNPISARRVKPVALWSGVVQTDHNGLADVTFDVPQFNGKLVVMAVAAREDRFGSASQEIIVRDKIVLQESFPRFTAPNDIIEGLVSVFNNTGGSADIRVELDLVGPAELISETAQTVQLMNDTEGNVVFRLKAGLPPGKITCRITAHGGGDSAAVDFEMPNRPPQPLQTVSGSGAVTAGRPATFALPGEWVAGTAEYTIRTSSLAAVSFARNIQYLLSYPYGCLEQTTSRLFPLLYFNDLARFVQPGVFGGGGPDYFIQEGIIKLRSMGLADGAFAFWPGGTRQHHWSTVYASHFLVEAQKAGYAIDEKFYRQVLDNVKRIARGKDQDSFDRSQRIYAAFVLARAGKSDNKIINHLMKLDPAELPVYSRYQLAGALAAAGEREYARSLIPAQIQPDLFEPETGGNFNSDIRSYAILLDVLLELDPESPSVPVLVQFLMEGARMGRWRTTQAGAFALLALGEFFKGQADFNFVGTIEIAGDSTYQIDTTSFLLERKDLAEKPITVSIDGEGQCFYFWQASGVPAAQAAEEFDRGLKVRRLYLDEFGEELDLTQVKLGRRVICRITAEAVDRTLYNVVINDLLPAGLEIENPRIKTSPALSWIPKGKGKVDYQDIRDDRLLLFADLRPGQPLEYYYSLRAVSAGDFVIPPLAAECMYNPLIAGAASTGRMIVIRVDD